MLQVCLDELPLNGHDESRLTITPSCTPPYIISGTFDATIVAVSSQQSQLLPGPVPYKCHWKNNTSTCFVITEIKAGRMSDAFLYRKFRYDTKTIWSYKLRRVHARLVECARHRSK